MSGNQVAVVSKPSQQVATAPQRTLAERMFPNSGHKGSEAPVETTKQRDARITAQENADYHETIARLKPEHIAHGQRFYQRFATPALKSVVEQRGWGSNLHVMDLCARANMTIEALEQELARLKGRK